MYTIGMNSTEWSEESLKNMPSEFLCTLILNMQKSIDRLTEQNQQLQNSYDKMCHQYDNLLEEIALMNQHRFGRKTETASTLFHQEQLDLGFNEVEAAADPNESEPTIDDVAPQAKKKKRKGKRADDMLKITDHEERHYELSEEQLRKIFGEGGYKKLPDEVTWKTEFTPAQLTAVAIYTAKYASKTDDKIVRAKAPENDFMPKTLATPSMVSSIITAKYVNAVPLYRQENFFHDMNLDLKRSTMANWVMNTSERYLTYVRDKMKDELLSHDVIHADETPFEVTKDGRSAGSKSYMWVYRNNINTGSQAVIIYDYCHTRGHENLERFLGNYHGTIQDDGYSAYSKLAKDNPDVFTIAGCYVHLKRYFAKVLKINGKGFQGTLAEIGVRKIQAIFMVDNEFKDLKPEDRKKKREEMVKPLVDDFFQWVKQNQQKVDKESATGRAFTYALNQEPYLRTFLKDGRIELSNNAAEIAIRSFTVGRKNWQIIDTPKGAEASAVIYSIVETAKANRLKVYEYFKYLFEELPKYINDLGGEVPDKLMPWSPDLPAEIRR